MKNTEDTEQAHRYALWISFYLLRGKNKQIHELETLPKCRLHGKV